jgi:hypothetical protein
MMFYGHEPDGASTTDLASTSVYGLDELNPCWIEITSRAPVNINTAPREILVALLCDLEGFYLIEQQRALLSPHIHDAEHLLTFITDPILISALASKGIYRFDPAKYWVGNQHEWCHVPDDYACGEIGVLLRTAPLGSAKQEESLAKTIADEIVKRRAERPFTTWRDFNTFIDELVVKGIIRDPKGEDFFHIYQDRYVVFPSLNTYPYSYYASLAIADTIKANFNPNLHLNELNPDASLWQWVDKTDLIKNSTELCFLPTGYFEIESVGQILRAEWKPGKFHISPYLLIMKDSFTHNNQIMGQRRLKVIVKLWDLYRDTSQRDFYQGTSFSKNRAEQYVTQLNQACISMPEPDNGSAPLQNNWEGYVCLSTMGATGLPKQKGKYVSTPPADHTQHAEHNMYSNMHAHFEFDFRLHSHRDELYEPQAESITYDQKQRLCRGYRWGGKDLGVQKLNPLDLRSDGFYAERLAQLKYLYGAINQYRGTVSLWIKPAFLPELHGKGRVFADTPMLHIYYAWERWSTYDHGVGQPMPLVSPFPRYQGYLLNYSDAVYYGKCPYGAFGLFAGIISRPATYDVSYPIKYWLPVMSRNIVGEKLVGHRWMHIAFSAKLRATSEKYGVWQGVSHGGSIIPQLWINGKRQDYYSVKEWWMHLEKAGFTGVDGILLTTSWSSLSDLCLFKDHINLGSRCENLPADSTIDEFYHWDKVIGEDYEQEPGKVCDACGGGGFAPCYNCNGTGGPATCPECEGEGYLILEYQWESFSFPCPLCNAEGVTNPCRICLGTKIFACQTCNGEGYLRPVCDKCGGNGWLICPTCNGGGFSGQICTVCDGEGVIPHPNPPHPPLYEVDEWELEEHIWDEHIDELCFMCFGYDPECEFCDGIGYIAEDPACKGSGRQLCATCKAERWVKIGGVSRYVIDCDACDGSGAKSMSPEQSAIRRLWLAGRYYRQNDAEFTSKTITLNNGQMVKTCMPAPNTVSDPYGEPRWNQQEKKLRKQIADQFHKIAGHLTLKLLGLTWTAYSWDIQDHKPTLFGFSAELLDPEFEVSIEIKDSKGEWLHIAGPFLDCDAGWAGVIVNIPSGIIRYRVRFNTHCDPENAILLETPVLDDLTIYYTTHPQFVSWVEGR